MILVGAAIAAIVIFAVWTTLEAVTYVARRQRVADAIQAEETRQRSIQSVERTEIL